MTLHLAFLRFSTRRADAGRLLADHELWIARGIDDGSFLLVGGLGPGLGGVVVARGLGRLEFEARVAEDPFVANDVVVAEFHSIVPTKVDPRLGFLLHGSEETTR